MSVTRLEWAQWMAKQGLTVFILKPDSKRPLDGHSWYTRNTTDPDVVSDWFEEDEGCNYAVHPGDKYVVIDLDIKLNVNGINTFDALCKEHGFDNWMMDLDTLMVQTPSGGFHLYFKSSHPCANKHDLGAGIDVRGAIGYVVGPGSENEDGPWQVMDPDAEIAPLPEWLAERLYEPGRKDPRREEPLCDWDLPESIAQGRQWLKYQPPAIEIEHRQTSVNRQTSLKNETGLAGEGCADQEVDYTPFDEACHQVPDRDGLAVDNIHERFHHQRLGLATGGFGLTHGHVSHVRDAFGVFPIPQVDHVAVFRRHPLLAQRRHGPAHLAHLGIGESIQDHLEQGEAGVGAGAVRW